MITNSDNTHNKDKFICHPNNNTNKLWFNYAFGPHFGVKISKWYPYF